MSDLFPTDITLHKKSRVLDISFSDGQRFALPCEYLRVFSRAADHRTLTGPVTGKERVNIQRLEPQGDYGVRIHFDDGHDTAIYSFETLHELGRNYQANWAGYLQRLDEIGYQRPAAHEGAISVTMLPFAWLARVLGSDEEVIELPAGEQTVADALAVLRGKPGRWAELLRDDAVEIEINDMAAALDTRLEHLDQVIVLPKSPTAPGNE